MAPGSGGTVTFLDAGGKPSSAKTLGRHNMLPPDTQGFSEASFLIHDLCAVYRFLILKLPRTESLLYFTNFH